MRSYGNSFTCAEPPYLVGGWSEYAHLRPGTFTYKANHVLSSEELVPAEPFCITCSLDKLKEMGAFSIEGFNSGDTVVIQGVGPIGMLHLIHTWIMGAGEVIVTDKSPYRLKMALEFGADVALDVERTAFQERVDRVKQMTEGRGADVVLEMTNSPQAFVEGIEILRRGGTLLEMGNSVDTGEVQINVHRHICSKNIRLVGLTNHPTTGYGPSLKLMEKYRNTYPFKKLISNEYALSDIDNKPCENPCHRTA